MALDRETVVRTALRLIDEGGLESLTLRKLASELGVQAPALYWHVKNKRELLDLVAVVLTNEQRELFATTPVEGQPWTDWVAQRTLAARQSMLEHRDSALIAAGNRPTPESLPAAEELLASLVAIGLPPAEALMFVLSNGYYLVGAVLERQVGAARESQDSDAALDAALRDTEQFPQMAAAVAGILERVGGVIQPDMGKVLDDEVFRYGLGLMIDGLKARLERANPQSE